jgi:hypothetical protein
LAGEAQVQAENRLRGAMNKLLKAGLALGE